MKRASLAITVAAITMLICPVVSFAQSGGGSSAGGSSSAGSMSAGTSGITGAPPARGTNSAGTAQSSGRGVTMRSARSKKRRSERHAYGDAAINEENKDVDRRVKSICRGC